MQPKKSLSMRELYREVRHYTDVGIQGYNLVKKYEDPAAAIRSRDDSTYKRKVKQLKRGSYLDDQCYAKKDIPGVCTYNILGKQLPKERPPKNVPDKKTYLDEAIQASKKNHVPAPGHYNVLQMMGSRLASGHSVEKQRSLSHKKADHKISYLDNAEYEGSLTPGVGQYIIQRGMRSKTEHNAIKTQKKPQFWIEYHKQASEKKLQRIKNEGPSIGNYNPKPIQYQLFQQKKKMNRIESQAKVARLKPTRFRTEQKIDAKRAQLGPGKYNVLNQWAPKQKNKKGILAMISKAPAPSVYYPSRNNA